MAELRQRILSLVARRAARPSPLERTLITLTRDYQVIYQRFLERNVSPERHRGHVVNDCYPEKVVRSTEEMQAASIRFEDYMYGIEHRGFDTFTAGDVQIKVDTTDFSKINMEQLLAEIRRWREL